MQKIFADMFSRPPLEIIDGDYYYSEKLTEEERIKGVADGIGKGLGKCWDEKLEALKSPVSLGNPFPLCDAIAEHIAQSGKPFMELACGWAMGIAPFVLMKNPLAPCLLTDKQALTVRMCRHYVDHRLPESNIGLAAVDGNDIPLHDGALDYVTGQFGFNFVCRNDPTFKGVHEVYRVLKPGGCFAGTEGEWEYNDAALEWLRVQEEESSDLAVATMLIKEKRSWRDVFESAGFHIESDEHFTFTRKMLNAKLLNPEEEKHYPFDDALIHRTTFFVARK